MSVLQESVIVNIGILLFVTINMKHIITLCGQNARIFNVKPVST